MLWIKINNINTNLDLNKVINLGGYMDTNIRPILVKNDTRNDALNVITSLIPNSYFVSFDLTKYQRDHYYLLKIEAKNFHEFFYRQKTCTAPLCHHRARN